MAKKDYLSRTTLFVLIFSLLALIVVILWAMGWGPFQGKGFLVGKQITNFKECEKAGYPIMESYPRQCKGPDGKTHVEIIDDGSGDSDDDNVDPKDEMKSENADYYGRSTFASCSADTDCVVSGCNAEICQGKDEESMVSICLLPDRDTPTEAGYTCGCVNSQCQWAK